jgi:hypothetical protein
VDPYSVIHKSEDPEIPAVLAGLGGSRFSVVIVVSVGGLVKRA